MPEKQKINILWFSNNLRIRDNESLVKIQPENLPSLALYVFDSDFYQKRQFGFRKIGKFRTQFLLETVLDLEKNLEQIGIPFVKKFGKTAEVFQEIAQHFEIETIFCQEEWTRDEILMQRKVEKVLPATIWCKSYSQLLLQPDFVYSQIEKIPIHFTVFRQKIEKNFTVREEFRPEKSEKKSNFESEIKSDDIDLKLLGFEDFETHPSSAFPFSGGEIEVLKRLNTYFFEHQNLNSYKETRNGMIGSDYSSKFSAWLANGSLSPVSVYHEIKKYEAEFGSNESTYWLVFELLWREFFKYVSMQYQDKIFQITGILDKTYACDDDENTVQRWIRGKTESDFINANMNEIRQTGFMSNRGRQNVASYFCKILNQDWRIGAAYFEEMLIDYDVHSNYGNWMYVAGVGNDPRNRRFNPEKQAEAYDNDFQYRDLWLQ